MGAGAGPKEFENAIKAEFDTLQAHMNSVNGDPNAPAEHKEGVTEVVGSVKTSLNSAKASIDKSRGAISDAEKSQDIRRAADHVNQAARDSASGPSMTLEKASDRLYKLSDDMTTWANNVGGKSADADSIKHADHDQSSHGGGRGGGGGAAAGKIVDEAEDEMDDAYKKIVQEAGKNPTSKITVMEAAQIREDASNHIEDARNNIFRGNNPKAVTALNNAAKVMKDEPRFKPAAQKLSDLASSLKDNSSGKSSTVDYRKALQSALQLLSLNKSEETPMKDSIVELPTEAVGDLLKFDKSQYEAAREALANLIAVEAGEMRDGHNELQSIAHLLEAVAHLHAWYEGEEAEGEVMEQETDIELAAASTDKEMKPKKGESLAEFKARCKEAGMADGYADKMYGKYMGAEEDTEKSADIAKCLECGCNQPGSDHGLKTTNDFANIAMPSNVSTAEMYAPGETPKSAEADETATEEAPTEETPAEAPVEEAVTEDSEAPTEVDAADVEAIVEQVVKSATESLRAEIASLVAAKEVALEKSVNLESELAIAKSLAVAGGPSRTTKPLSTKINDNLTKAAIYKAKANATTDPVLAKGYKQLAEEFYSKASDSDNN
jgi:hypothetical protein